MRFFAEGVIQRWSSGWQEVLIVLAVRVRAREDDVFV